MFRIKAVKFHKNAFERQIYESVRIQSSRNKHILLNSKAEYNRCALPRLGMKWGDKEYKENREEEQNEEEAILEGKIRQMKKDRNKERRNKQEDETESMLPPSKRQKNAKECKKKKGNKPDVPKDQNLIIKFFFKETDVDRPISETITDTFQDMVMNINFGTELSCDNAELAPVPQTKFESDCDIKGRMPKDDDVRKEMDKLSCDKKPSYDENVGKGSDTDQEKPALQTKSVIVGK